MRAGKVKSNANKKLQGDLLRKSGAQHRMGRSQAIEGRTPDGQTTPPRRNKNLKPKASVR